MAVVATTLNDAIALTNQQVGLGNPLNLLNQQITQFTAAWTPNFDRLNENDRTLRNWEVRSQVVINETPVIGNAQERQAVINVICRVMYAAIAAETAGRITTAQRDAVLAAWNASVGANP